jgi:uncharacterized protein (TIGR02646 family)
MKYVKKSHSPAELEQWKTTGNDDWQPSYGGLNKEIKEVLHKSLLAEQGYVCCYCGGEVTIEDSHIEHFYPQSEREELQLDYSNLHASCIKSPKARTPIHCGHKKGNAFDVGRMISPQETGCEQRFFYTLDGNINIKNDGDEAAKYMSKILELSSVALKIRREKILRTYFTPAFIAEVSIEELTKLASVARLPKDGKLPDLGHVLACYSERLAENLSA